MIRELEAFLCKEVASTAAAFEMRGSVWNGCLGSRRAAFEVVLELLTDQSASVLESFNMFRNEVGVINGHIQVVRVLVGLCGYPPWGRGRAGGGDLGPFLRQKRHPELPLTSSSLCSVVLGTE